MKRTRSFFGMAVLLATVAACAGCAPPSNTSTNGDASSTDTGSDADADSDSDSDSDSDADGDSDTTTSTGFLDGGPGDDCAHAIEVDAPDGGVAVYTGSWDDYGNDFDSANASCDLVAGKPDVFFHAMVRPSNRLLVEEPGFISSTINILSSCAAKECLATSRIEGRDSAYYVNGGTKPMSLYAVVGTRWAMRGDFEIRITNSTVPAGSSCTYPIVVPTDKAPWTTDDLAWSGFFDSFTADATTCPIPSYPTPVLGNDIWFRVDVPPHQILGVVNNDFVSGVQGHVLHVVAECGVSTCLDTADGYSAGTVTYANDADAAKTIFVVVQQVNGIATPPDLTFALLPIPEGFTCKTAFEVAPGALPYAKSGQWLKFIDTGSSTGTGCSPSSILSGSEDVWFKVTVPGGLTLAAVEDGLISTSYNKANLTLHEGCGDSTCLASGSGKLAWSNDASGERTVYLHVERTDTAMGDNFHVALFALEVDEGVDCKNPFVVSSLPWVKDFPIGIDIYLDDMQFTDATCASSSTQGPEVVFRRDMLKDETIKMGLGGLSGLSDSSFQIMVQRACGGDKQCSASMAASSLTYTAAENGPVYFIVEDIYDLGYSFFVSFWTP
ncbi:MAG: hypothetical protein PHU25_10345 [Deltaproteobacteria bacterium]|nr:hypothetical protein [Deltaproteobacteria bacterium]